MSKKYSDKLKDPRWQKKRLEVLKRDEWQCQRCHDSKSMLAVHHRRYLVGKEPWDYPDELLITLCENCHEDEREARPDYEDDLLSILREKFFADDIHSILLGFFNLRIRYDSQVMADMIKFALSTPSVINMIDEVYWENIKKYAEKKDVDN